MTCQYDHTLTGNCVIGERSLKPGILRSWCFACSNMAFKESQGSSKESQVEDFSNNAIAKSLSMKNKRAACNWQQLVRAIEIQKNEMSAELDHNRNKLLNKRDEIETRTVSLSSKKPLNFQHQKPALLNVYDNLVASIEKEKRAKSGSVSESVTRQTQSSERKKVVRKNVSLSLSALEKQGSKANLRTKSKKQIMEDLGEDNSAGDRSSIQHTRPKSAFDFTEEEKDISRKLYCFPTALPRIYLQTSHRPRFRSFDKDDVEYRKKITGADEESWRDIHQCRYLRLQRSYTVYDMRTSSNTVKSTT